MSDNELTPEETKILTDFYNKLCGEQVDLEPEVVKMINENFWELLA